MFQTGLTLINICHYIIVCLAYYLCSHPLVSVTIGSMSTVFLHSELTMSEDTVIYQGITRQQTKCYISPFSLPPLPSPPLLIVILNKQNLLFTHTSLPGKYLLLAELNQLFYCKCFILITRIISFRLRLILLRFSFLF